MRKVNPFGPDADSVIAEGFFWLDEYLSQVVPPLAPFVRERRKRLANGLKLSASEIQGLQIMAANCEHLEVGGRAIREASNFCTGGDVIGRTVWVGKPEWAEGFLGDEIRTAVSKALDGKTLGPKQALLIEVMLKEIRDTKANLENCPF